MKIDVAPLPRLIDLTDARDRIVVVFDVLRATTTMAAALAARVGEIRIFDSLHGAEQAASAFDGPKLLCGERRCLKPEGFDAGNSPGEYSERWAGRTMFMATTNGTRAIVAAGRPRQLLVGALVNIAVTVQVIQRSGGDVLLLCAGTDSRIAAEDLIGAGALIEAVAAGGEPTLESDAARIARHLFLAARHDLAAALSESQGGQNVIAAGLACDIDFAARLDGVPVAGQVLPDPLRVVRIG
jgi:2-phosphosulfolactate phosphatase